MLLLMDWTTFDPRCELAFPYFEIARQGLEAYPRGRVEMAFEGCVERWIFERPRKGALQGTIPKVVHFVVAFVLRSAIKF